MQIKFIQVYTSLCLNRSQNRDVRVINIVVKTMFSVLLEAVLEINSFPMVTSSKFKSDYNDFVVQLIKDNSV